VTADAEREAPHFVLAHGFTQTARSWKRIEALLANAIPGATTTAVDLPDHGDAPAAVSGSDLWRSADHLVERGGPGIYVGYSMGGRVTLHAALTHPDDLEAMVLIGATAGIEDDTERADRRDDDERLATRMETVGVDRFLEEWLRNPLFAGLTAEAAQVDDRRRNTSDGLTTSLRSTGTGTQEPLWERLQSITAPTLVLAGEHDAKFRALGERLAASIPDSTLHVIPGSGHTTHLEQPEATVEAIAVWLSSR
jgi:2-succinyl-6-hydroxy-2,4-cyclohexadiene-1-carboxylate synthase